MARKQRYWVCDECPWWGNRLKAERYRGCPRCGEGMRKARTFPMKAYHKYQRQRAKQRKEKERLRKKHAVPRTCFGYRLRLSTKTKRAFRELRKARQKRSFLKRGQAFLDSLRDDVWRCPHHRGYIPGGRGCGCAGGGHVNPPTLYVMTNKRPWRDGAYMGGLFARRFGIEVEWAGDDRLATLIHEVTHYVDHMADVSRERGIGAHSRPFKKRMADIAKQLRYPMPSRRR